MAAQLWAALQTWWRLAMERVAAREFTADALALGRTPALRRHMRGVPICRQPPRIAALPPSDRDGVHRPMPLARMPTGEWVAAGMLPATNRGVFLPGRRREQSPMPPGAACDGFVDPTPVPTTLDALRRTLGAKWAVFPCDGREPYFYVPVDPDGFMPEMRATLGCDGGAVPQWVPVFDPVPACGDPTTPRGRLPNVGVWQNPAMIRRGLNAAASLLTNFQCFGTVVVREDPPFVAADADRACRCG